MFILAKRRLSARWVALCAVLSTLCVWPCSVPVYRYAMEHWPSDPYQAIMFHRGLLSETQQALLRNFKPDGLAGELHANISLKTVDLNQDPKPELLDLWRQIGSGKLPWLLVRYPATVRAASAIWSGPLTDQAPRQILDSPARKEITGRLVDGQNPVWLLIECGDRKKDDDTAAVMGGRLAYLNNTLKLPKLDAQDIKNGLVSVPEEDLRLEFSLFRLSRTDPAEKAFVAMLLCTEPDLADAKEPVAIPIFGRGRALY